MKTSLTRWDSIFGERWAAIWCSKQRGNCSQRSKYKKCAKEVSGAWNEPGWANRQQLLWCVRGTRNVRLEIFSRSIVTRFSRSLLAGSAAHAHNAHRKFCGLRRFTSGISASASVLLDNFLPKICTISPLNNIHVSALGAGFTFWMKSQIRFGLEVNCLNYLKIRAHPSTPAFAWCSYRCRCCNIMISNPNLLPSSATLLEVYPE